MKPRIIDSDINQEQRGKKKNKGKSNDVFDKVIVLTSAVVCLSPLNSCSQAGGGIGEGYRKLKQYGASWRKWIIEN